MDRCYASEAREAAESLLTSVHTPQYRYLANLQSLNLIPEDVMQGHRRNGHMSTVRRFFCLLVTFDLLFTAIMWLCCVMIRGGTLFDILNSEIVHYNVKTSLFDILGVAVMRFVLLILFYAIIYINNWSVIALSTGGACALLIGKVFLFDWKGASEPVYVVFLILSSFTIAWGEAWFLDFRVIPLETHAKSVFHAIESIPHTPSAVNERTALLDPWHRARTTHPESTVDWFSPAHSPASTPGRARAQHCVLTQEMIDEYKRQAEQSLQEAWSVVNLPDWKIEKKGSGTDVVESKTTQKYGKVYRFTGMVDCPAVFLYKEFKDGITKLPEWNPTILRSELIKEIGDGIDLSYQVTAGGGGGLISQRDFVILRRNAGVDRRGHTCTEPAYAYVSSGVSVEVPGYPPTHNNVRGHNKVGCWCLKPVTVKTSSGKLEERTVFQWLMCCDLKGKIPQFVLDTAFSKVMFDYIVHVRKHVVECKSKGLI